MRNRWASAWETPKKIKTMGLIKEPVGIDFIIQSPPLTEKERKEISESIQNRKRERKLFGKSQISKETKINKI
jgi:hypothetical protein